MNKADISLSLRCDSSPEAQAKVQGGGDRVSIVDGTRAGQGNTPEEGATLRPKPWAKARPANGSAQQSRGKGRRQAGKASKQGPLWFTSPLRNPRSSFACLWTVDRGVEKKKANGVTLGFQ